MADRLGDEFTAAVKLLAQTLEKRGKIVIKSLACRHEV